MLRLIMAVGTIPREIAKLIRDRIPVRRNLTVDLGFDSTFFQYAMSSLTPAPNADYDVLPVEFDLGADGHLYRRRSPYGWSKRRGWEITDRSTII